jgi:hypothetical protein
VQRPIIEIKTGCCVSGVVVKFRRNAVPKSFPVAHKAIPPVPAITPTRTVPGDAQQYPATSIEKRGGGTYVPAGQQERILHRHVIGQSVRMICREEHRDFRTVAKVIRNNPARLKEHLEAGRALFYALTTQALETIRLAMEKGDAELAYRLLVDAGVVPKAGEVPWVIESESSETPETRAKKKHVAELVELALERAADYPLPSGSI